MLFLAVSHGPTTVVESQSMPVVGRKEQIAGLRPAL